jgi:hypothetical protein
LKPFVLAEAQRDNRKRELEDFARKQKELTLSKLRELDVSDPIFKPHFHKQAVEDLHG